jgi:hypothetical protein
MSTITAARQTVKSVRPVVRFDSTRPRKPAPTFGAGLVEAPATEAAKPARKAESRPTPEDHAWNLGYTLGRTFTPAAPDRDASESEKAAFLAGYTVGHTLAEDEALANDAGYNAALDAMYADEYGDEPPYGYE